MAASRFFSNTAVQTALSGNISSGATALTVNVTTGFPGTFPYTLAIDFGGAAEELVNVTSAASTTLTVTRAYGGTSAQSHSIGAVVRHVYDATEAAAFRAHEGATAAVHGITGNVVGTSDAQTLGNKTLTAPTINGGTFSGTPTFTGNPTFSGSTTALTVTGEIAHSSLYRGTRANATDSQWESRVTGDANARFYARADGQLNWGPGGAGADTSFQRNGVGQAQLNGIMAVASSNTGVVDHLLVNTGGSTNAASNLLSLKNSGTQRASVSAGGTLSVLPTAGYDAIAVNTPAATSGSLLNLQANSVTKADMDSTGAFQTYGGNTWSTYTPVVTSSGSPNFSRQLGWYQRLGKIVFIEIYLATSATGGSGSTPITISLPTQPFRDGAGPNTTRQVMGGYISGPSGSGNAFQQGPLTATVLAGSSGMVIDDIRDAVATSMWGQNWGTSTSMTIQGWYREA